MVFVVESPVRSDGGIEHEGHQYLCSSHLAETKLVDGDLSGALPQCFYVRDRSVDLGLPQIRFGQDPGVARPCRMMTMVSPHSTSSRSWGR